MMYVAMTTKTTISFTVENLCKALELAKKLKCAIIDIEANIQRAVKISLKFN